MSNISLLSGKKGFTLIELLVVISIIGLLSSIVLASVSTARVRAQDTALRQVARQLRTVYEIELLKNNSYAALMPSSTVVGSGYLCTVTTSPAASQCIFTLVGGCTIFFAAHDEAEKICMDAFAKKSSLSIGVIGGNVASDFGLYMPLVSTPSTGVCVRSNGNVVTTTGVTPCITKSNW